MKKEWKGKPQQPQRRIIPESSLRRQEGLSSAQLAEIQHLIGIKFRDPQVLELAFVHRSYLNENPNGRIKRHNEVLEFLGDAVLDLASTDKLVRMFPDLLEGKLTSYRAALVNSQKLATIAKNFGLEPFLLMSKGETQDTGPARRHILANTFEALVGAIYLDRGQGVSELFLADVLFGNIEDIVMKRQYLDPKSYLQKMAQKRISITPHYETLEQRGPDHNKWFRIAVFFQDRLIAEGTGRSKPEAQESAAYAALEKEYGITLNKE